MKPSPKIISDQQKIVNSYELVALIARRIQEINRGIDPPPTFIKHGAGPDEIATYEIVSKKLEGYYLEKSEVRNGEKITVLYPLQNLIFPRTIFPE